MDADGSRFRASAASAFTTTHGTPLAKPNQCGALIASGNTGDGAEKVGPPVVWAWRLAGVACLSGTPARARRAGSATRLSVGNDTLSQSRRKTVHFVSSQT